VSERQASVCAINVITVPTETVFRMYEDLRIGPVHCLLLALWQSDTANWTGVGTTGGEGQVASTNVHV